MELFKRYFEDGGDITSFDLLIAAAEKAGIEPDKTKKWLEDGSGGEKVDEEVEKAYAQGISGVPNFTIQGKYVIGGAQDPQDFFDVIVAAKEGKSADSMESEICS
jgi:predicted DsbA family dithiol-disulfide isomerase